MEPFRYHVFICEQQKPEGVPCCIARGSKKVMEALRREISAQGLADEVQITTCGSLGLCESGPNMVVYPEGVWYSGVQPEDVPEIVRSHFRDGIKVERLAHWDRSALRAEIQMNRDHYLAAMKAHDAAGMLPEDLAEKIRGFQESRTILTALELNVFTAIGQGGTASDVARKIKANPRSTEMLLHALAALELLEKKDGVFHNAPVAARFFSDDSPDSARLGLLHQANLWPRWSTLTDCVRAGTAMPREERFNEQEWTEAFIAAMDRNARERAPLVARAVNPGSARRMLDVGGGSGAYAIAFVHANPALQADIMDRENVLPITQRHVQDAGLSGRIKARAGDLTRDKLGEGYDLMLISAICHMLGPEENRDLLKRAYAALASGGRLVIQDFILEPDKTRPRFGALFALNMLVGTRAGSSYSEPEYDNWLRGAGFSDIQRVRLPGTTGLMVATRH